MSRLAMITFLSGPDAVDPGFGVPDYSGGHPSQGLPNSPGHPSNALPGGGHITTLPVFPFDPTDPGYGIPEGGSGNKPDKPQSPGHPSIQPIVPGRKFVVKWLACWGLVLVPDQSLPETPEPK